MKDLKEKTPAGIIPSVDVLTKLHASLYSVPFNITEPRMKQEVARDIAVSTVLDDYPQNKL